jgi:hypothetical protein
MTYILDACALLALLNEEFGKGYETVKGLLESAVKGEATLRRNLLSSPVISNLSYITVPVTCAVAGAHIPPVIQLHSKFIILALYSILTFMALVPPFFVISALIASTIKGSVASEVRLNKLGPADQPRNFNITFTSMAKSPRPAALLGFFETSIPDITNDVHETLTNVTNAIKQTNLIKKDFFIKFSLFVLFE